MHIQNKALVQIEPYEAARARLEMMDVPFSVSIHWLGDEHKRTNMAPSLDTSQFNWIHTVHLEQRYECPDIILDEHD